MSFSSTPVFSNWRIRDPVGLKVNMRPRLISRTTAPSPVCVVRTLSESLGIGSPGSKLPLYSAYSAAIPGFLPVNAPDIRITNNSAEDTSSEIAGGDKLNLQSKATSTNR